METVGTLRNARRVSFTEDPRGPCLHGQVYGDTKGRFRDGEYITTSTIMSEDGDVFKTRYSAYKVEHWEGAATQPDEDAFMVPGMGAQPVHVKEWVAANDNVVTEISVKHAGSGTSKQAVSISDHYRGAVDSWMAAPDWDGIVKTAADRFSAVHETLAKSERGQYIGLTRPGDPNGCADDLATTTFAPLEELPGWIEWDGVGPMPVGRDDRVTIKLRNGLTNSGPAVVFNWLHGRGGFGYEGDDDIISYRVLSTAPRPSSSDTGRRGPLIQLYSGRQFFPLSPRPEEVHVEDIAHHLSNICRYSGATLSHYSVAEHSVHVAWWLLRNYGPLTAMHGLMHDAPEALSGFGDAGRTMKSYVPFIKQTEDLIYRQAIAPRFNLAAIMPAAVHEADNRIIADETSVLHPMEWHEQHNDPLGVLIAGWSADRAEAEFLEMYLRLDGMLNRSSP